LLHLRILQDHQNQVLKKVVKNVFWCICTYFQITKIMGSKIMFLNVWCISDAFRAYFQTTRIKFLKKIFFNVWNAKNVFVAFSHTFRPPETWAQKWCYLTSGVVIYVFWCICAYFQTTRIKFLKKIFFNILSG
jgi:hypothetical protein